jgi:hypothetical protein
MAAFDRGCVKTVSVFFAVVLGELNQFVNSIEPTENEIKSRTISKLKAKCHSKI